MRTVDTRGKVCPVPLIETRRALKECAEGDIIEVITDNKTSYINVSRFLADNGLDFSSSESDGIWTVTVKYGRSGLTLKEAEAYCDTGISHFEKGDYVVLLTSDTIGEGDPALGHVLMKSFFRALHDMEKLPMKILCYNSAVKLAAKGSELEGDIRDLEKMGVEILLCSTCVEHYGLGNALSAGQLSNMFVIAGILTSASRIVRP